MKRVYLLLFIPALFIFSSFNNKRPYQLNYVDQYCVLAIKEMNKSGIPASITLAQAIVESDCGNSKLARSSNNHFGIKCKSYWEGGKYYHKDDDLDKQGNLIKSCFRSYPSVVSSYKDRTEFLTSTSFYADLFYIHRTDYKSWAYGLSKAGYATDPTYAEKLIKTIEKYNLSRFDSIVIDVEDEEQKIY